MNSILGKPHALKQVNLSLVRKILREKGSATRAEIVEATGISGTTVRTLLSEMLENGETAGGGFDKSIGGRKAVRYQLQKDRYFGVAFCIGGAIIPYIIVNICGEICTSGTFEAGRDSKGSICAFLDRITADMEIRSIGIGVPGVVDGLEYQRKNAEGYLLRYPIGEHIRQRYGVPVLLESDLYAITLGFGRCYMRQFPEESWDDIHMAYICFDKDCLSAGFLSDGRILHGWNNFVGELGLYPVDENRTLDDLLSDLKDDNEYACTVAKLAAGICCVLNPQYIALGGCSFRKDCLPLVTEHFNGYLPDKMTAEILYAEDSMHDYLEGMAYLTSEQIFEGMKLIRE